MTPEDLGVSAATERTHTIDVQTVNGWVRLELTDAQVLTLAFELKLLAPVSNPPRYWLSAVVRELLQDEAAQ